MPKNNMDMEEFWNRVNKLIKEGKKTQRSLSLECGFTERRIESLSTGNRSPDVIEVVKIARALNTSVEYLVTGEEKELPTDISDIALKLTELTPEQRAPLIFMVNSQIDFYKR